MSVRDLFNNSQPRSNQNYYNPYDNSGRTHNLFKRIVGQFVVAVLLFAGIVYCYDHQGKLGDGVRLAVAMVTSEDSDMLAVNGDFFPKVSDDTADDANLDMNQALPTVKNSKGQLMMILPATGLMERGFGDVSADGVKYDSMDIVCNSRQPVKASASGKITAIDDLGEGNKKITITHDGDVQSFYQGKLEVVAELEQNVMQGVIIAYIDNNVLNFSVWENGVAVDPFLFLNGPE